MHNLEKWFCTLEPQCIQCLPLSGPQSAFIGFGGNVIRQQVKERSSWYVTSFGELLKELEKI